MGLASRAHAAPNYGGTASDCRNDGYLYLFRADATAFANVGECVTYGLRNDNEFGLGPHINVWVHTFSPDAPICYGTVDLCRGAELTGQGLQPDSTVTITETSSWYGVTTYLEPVDANGDFWMLIWLDCHTSGAITATGSSWNGEPLLGYSEYFPVC